MSWSALRKKGWSFSIYMSGGTGFNYIDLLLICLLFAITTPSSQNIQCCHASYILLGGTHPPILQLSTISFLFLCLFPFSLPNVNFKELTHAMEKPLKCSKQMRAVGTHFNESKYNFFTNPPISVSALKILFFPMLEKHSSPCYMRPKPWILTRASLLAVFIFNYKFNSTLFLYTYIRHEFKTFEPL